MKTKLIFGAIGFGLGATIGSLTIISVGTLILSKTDRYIEVSIENGSLNVNMKKGS